MGKALKQLWLAFTIMFTAFETIAETLNTLATVGKEMSGAYLDETRIERESNKQRLLKETGVTLS